MQTITRINSSLLAWGAVLILLGLTAPYIIGVKEAGILRLMEQSLVNNSGGDLLMASLRLVLLNTARALPLYTGVLLTAEGLGLFHSGKISYLMLLPIVIIPAAYEAIHLIYGIAYDFGTPAISLTLGVLIVSKMRDMTRHILHKTIVFALLLFGVQWLDIVPLLSGFWFGRGEISVDIKRIAIFLNAEDILNITGIAMFSTFVLNAFVTARLLRVYTREIRAVEQAWHVEQLAAQLQIQSLENRAFREMQALVHDLKTPLTTIQGLAEVIALSDTADANREYAKYISNASDKMNNMIRELLLDETRQTISARELIEYAVAHMPQMSGVDYRLKVADRLPPVCVNKIRMARAIINILENALEAVDKKPGRITVSLTPGEGNKVLVSIEDNGRGIADELNQRVWDVGFSTKNSSGLGLPFVREVVEKNGGQISIESAAGCGAKVIISLPGVQAL